MSLHDHNYNLHEFSFPNKSEKKNLNRANATLGLSNPGEKKCYFQSYYARIQHDIFMNLHNHSRDLNGVFTR